MSRIGREHLAAAIPKSNDLIRLGAPCGFHTRRTKRHACDRKASDPVWFPGNQPLNIGSGE